MTDPMTRRVFMGRSVLAAAAAATSTASGASPAAGGEGSPAEGPVFRPGESTPPPLVVSTWKHGATACRAALRVLLDGGSTLDAVEKGINAVELDPQVDSVGVGGLPDEDGQVTLD